MTFLLLRWLDFRGGLFAYGCIYLWRKFGDWWGPDERTTFYFAWINAYFLTNLYFWNYHYYPCALELIFTSFYVYLTVHSSSWIYFAFGFHLVSIFGLFVYMKLYTTDPGYLERNPKNSKELLHRLILKGIPFKICPSCLVLLILDYLYLIVDSSAYPKQAR